MQTFDHNLIRAMLPELLLTAVACVLFLLGVSMVLVHPGWSIEQGQFGWLLLIVFGTIALAGAGRWSPRAPPAAMTCRCESCSRS